MKKIFCTKKSIVLLPVFAMILCIILYAVFAKPAIEIHTWELFSAQQADPPYFAVAHHHNYTLDDDENNTFKFSKPIELTCVAKNGKLTVTDKTNNKTYNGTYKVKSWNRFTFQRYEIVIDGKEGIANISSRFNRTLSMSIDGYNLHFVIK